MTSNQLTLAEPSYFMFQICRSFCFIKYFVIFILASHPSSIQIISTQQPNTFRLLAPISHQLGVSSCTQSFSFSSDANVFIYFKSQLPRGTVVHSASKCDGQQLRDVCKPTRPLYTYKSAVPSVQQASTLGANVVELSCHITSSHFRMLSSALFLRLASTSFETGLVSTPGCVSHGLVQEVTGI